MTFNSMNYNKLCIIIFVVGLSFLIGSTIYNKSPVIFDELNFVPNVELISELGFTKEFLVQMKNQAPGPLYQLIHWPLMPLTHLKPPAIRVVNLVFLVLIIFITSKVIKNSFRGLKHTPLFLAMNIIVVPVTWVISGLALTEIPAMFFLVLSLLMLSYIFKNNYSNQKILLFSTIAGIFLGIAALGRTPYLGLILPILLVVFHKDFRSQKKAASLILPYFSIPLFFTVPIFIIWGGLVSPNQPIISGGIKLWYGFLSLGYGAIIFFLIAPKWFIFNRKILFAIVTAFIFAFVYSTWFSADSYYPFIVTIEKYAPSIFISIYKLIITPILICLAIYFVICSLVHLYERRDNIIYVFSILSAIMIMFSNITNSYQFSSRYVAQAIPFIIVSIVPFENVNWLKCLLAIVAMVIGFFSLNTYALIF